MNQDPPQSLEILLLAYQQASSIVFQNLGVIIERRYPDRKLCWVIRKWADDTSGYFYSQQPMCWLSELGRNRLSPTRYGSFHEAYNVSLSIPNTFDIQRSITTKAVPGVYLTGEQRDSDDDEKSTSGE